VILNQNKGGNALTVSRPKRAFPGKTNNLANDDKFIRSIKVSQKQSNSTRRRK
jgi:hypothetical protein